MDDDSATLERAARSDDLETIKRLIARTPVPAEEKNIARLAAENGHLNILQFLEERNSTLPGWTRRDFEAVVLHTSIEFAKWNIVKHYLEKEKVDVDLVNEFGEPPIFTALRCKHRDIFKYLVEERRANVTATDSRGNNILHAAVKAEDLPSVRYILDEKKIPIDVNGGNKLGDTPLHAAVLTVGNGQYDVRFFNWRKEIELIEYLVKEKKANVNAVGNNGKTPLHIAALLSHLKICNLLMDHGADPQFRDGGGHNYWEITGFKKRRIRSVPTHSAEDQSVSMLWNLPGKEIRDDRPSVQEVGPSALPRDLFPSEINMTPLVVITQLLFKTIRRSYAAPVGADYSFFVSPSDIVRRKVDQVALNAVRNFPN